MKRPSLAAFLFFAFSFFAFAQQSTNSDPDKAQVITSDIQLFWKAYDQATPENNLIIFRDEYLRKGSPGLKDFTALRIQSSCNLVAKIDAAPQYYRALREPSLKVAGYESKLRESFRKLKDLYSDAVFPDVYFLIGAMNSGGTTSRNGLLIGVDMYGKNPGVSLDGTSDWHKAVLLPTERIPFIVAHELIHFQQKYGPDDSLLARSLREGVPDLIAEMISGGMINAHLHSYGNPIEKELWTEFKKEMKGNDVSNWLYQGDKAKTRPADLGYYVGYKIAESYFKNAADKKQAIRDLLEIKDFAKILAESKYDEKLR